MRRLILLWLLLLYTPVYATTRYVATTGNDANSCSTSATITTPKATIQSGIGCMAAGDVLDIRAGTYTTSIDSYNYTIPSGTSFSNAITIQGHAGETVTIKPNAGSGWVLRLAHSNHHIIFDNLIMDADNVTYDGVKITCSGTCVGTQAHHIRLSNGEVKNAGLGDAETGSANHMGILIYGPGTDGCELINMTIDHNGSSAQFDHGIYIGQSTGTVIEGCLIHDNKEWGLQFYPNADSNTLRKSKVYSNGSGVLVATGSDSNLVYNNIIYNNTTGVAWSRTGIELYGAGNGNQIYNNTLYGNGSYGFNVDTSSATAANTILRNNIAYGNSTGQIGNTGTTPTVSNNLTSNPNFTNSGATDFTLTAGSLAVDRGFTLGSPYNTDYAGVTRANTTTTGSAYDIGAYEYVSPPNSITVITPNGGESWEIGTTQTITWTTVSAGATVEITADLDGNGSYETTITASTSNDGSYDWVVAGSANANCKIKVKDTGATTNDVSDAVFALTAATVTGTITIVTPAASAIYGKGTNVTISWTSTDINGNVTVELSRNNGNTWEAVGTYAYNASDVVYVATTPSSSTCKIRITSVNDTNVTATSSAFRLGGRIM